MLKLSPLFIEKKWGGKSLKRFGFSIPSNKTGEAWLISGYENNESPIKNEDLNLNQFYKKNKSLFNNYHSKDFPLLVKIIDAKNDLSVQVHPNDIEAKKFEGETNGKSECWHIIDCKKNNEIILGSKVKSKVELKSKIENNDWNNLFTKRVIKRGESFNVDPGTIHAICKGTLIYELQQSSDITYRFYDYDRLDDDGNKRELHIEKAIEVTKFSNNNILQKEEVIFKTAFFEEKQIISNKYFNLYTWEINGSEFLNIDKNRNFLLITNIGKAALINNCQLEKGQSIIILHNELRGITISGKTKLLVGNPK